MGRVKIDWLQILSDVFSHAFYTCLPTTHRVWQDVAEIFTKCVELENSLQDIQETMVCSLKKHSSANIPVSSYHCKQVALWLSAEIKILVDDNGRNLIPEFSKYLDEDCDEMPYVYRTYPWEEMKLVLLEENLDHLTHGTTGLITWQGARCLLDWADWSQALQGQRVLELGSGLGQFGLTAIKTLGIKELTMSDFHFSVLNYLNLNIRLNLSRDEENRPSQKELLTYLETGCHEPFNQQNARYVVKKYPDLNTSSALNIQHIDWRDYKTEFLPRVDMVVASDIVFAKELHESLASILHELLTLNECAAYIACTKRTEEGVVKSFTKIAEGKGLSCEIVYERTYSPGDGVISNYENLHPVKVFKFYLGGDMSNKDDHKKGEIYF